LRDHCYVYFILRATRPPKQHPRLIETSVQGWCEFHTIDKKELESKYPKKRHVKTARDKK
jgi:hypothetical protein